MADAPMTGVDESAFRAALGRIVVVLVEPSHPGNVGAAARALRTMGLARLALVAPRHADVLEQPDAIARASGATDVLAAATVHATLDDALADASHAIAMTARPRAFEPPAVPLRAATGDALARARDGAVVAFVFGGERFGLSNEDVLRCQARCRIDTSADYGSLNLSQAVQLVAYECRMAALANSIDEPGTEDAPLASHGEREALIAHFEEALVAIGFLDPDAPKKLMPRLRRLFARAGLEREEVQWLRGIAKAMLRTEATRRG